MKLLKTSPEVSKIIPRNYRCVMDNNNKGRWTTSGPEENSSTWFSCLKTNNQKPSFPENQISVKTEIFFSFLRLKIAYTKNQI